MRLQSTLLALAAISAGFVAASPLPDKMSEAIAAKVAAANAADDAYAYQEKRDVMSDAIAAKVAAANAADDAYAYQEKRDVMSDAIAAKVAAANAADDAYKYKQEKRDTISDDDLLELLDVNSQDKTKSAS